VKKIIYVMKLRNLTLIRFQAIGAVNMTSAGCRKIAKSGKSLPKLYLL
jgi:hypothetical protein